MTVWQTLMRRKRLESVTTLKTPLNRCASTLDLTFFGLGNMLGSSVYLVTGELVHVHAGPAACVSYLVAGFAALLSAMCYAELGSRFPRAGSAYTYTYVAVGEFMAFVIGWSVICEYVIGTSTVAKGWSDTLDSLLNYSMSNWTNTHLPFRSGYSAFQFNRPSHVPLQLQVRVPYHHEYDWAEANTTATPLFSTTTANSNATEPHYWIDQSPDLAGFGITMLFVLVLCCGAKSSLRFNNVTNSLSLFSLAIVCGVMFSHGDVANLTQPDGFAPFGFGGVLRGSAVAFYAYIGFDAVAVAAEEVLNPGKTVPRASAYCVIIVTAVMLLTTLALVIFVPYTEASSTAAFTDALRKSGITWAEIVCGVGGLIGMTAGMLCSVFALPRVVYAMASDGLLFSWLGKVASCSQVPVISTVLFGTVAAACALVFDFDALADMLSIGTLIAYSIVSANVIALRFMQNQPDAVTATNTEVVIRPAEGTGEEDADAFVNQSSASLRRDVSDYTRLLPSNAGQPASYSASNVAILASSGSNAALNISNSTECLINNSLWQRVGTLKPWWNRRCFVPNCIRNAPATRVPICALLVYVLASVCFCVSLVVADNMDLFQYCFPFLPIFILVPMIVSLLAMLLCIVVMSAFERCDAAIHTFRVPLVPLVPCLSITVNVLLIAYLNPLTWVRFGVWLALGLVVYFGYGIRHSTEALASKSRSDTNSSESTSISTRPSPPISSVNAADSLSNRVV